ncbi:538_t:CDS:10 [Ambispora gerdemannii]|uniref:538_t:CDS:1 n=1 Tax=Ambispora gerdemannii TaxID=144530 RepID=A0A9N9AFF7_9GLOM|nr:538_t:CDS:10 [Ambispora gerdemannii]
MNSSNVNNKEDDTEKNKPIIEKDIIPTQKKHGVFKQILAFIGSKGCKNMIKASLAYWLAFLLVFIHPFEHHFQRTNTLNNLILTCIVAHPGISVGAFLQGGIDLLMGVLFGGAWYALLNGGLGSSKAAMIVFVCCLFKVLSVVYLVVEYFDQIQLKETLIAFLLGLALSLVINLLLWPDSAEFELRRQLIRSLDNINTFNNLNIKSYLLTIAPSEKEHRDDLAHSIRADVQTLSTLLRTADSEISYSEFSLKEYTGFVAQIKRLQQYLLAVHGNIVAHEEAMKESEKFQGEFLGVLRSPLNNLNAGCSLVITSMKHKLDPDKKAQTVDMEAGIKAFVDIRSSLPLDLTIESSDGLLQTTLTILQEEQYIILRNLFNLELDCYQEPIPSAIENDNNINNDPENFGEGNSRDSISAVHYSVEAFNETNESKRADFLVDFFMFGIKEFVEELLQLRHSINNSSNSGTGERTKSIRIHFHSYLSDFLITNSTSSPPAGMSESKQSFRLRLSKFLQFFISPLSIFALKGALLLCLVLIPLLIGGEPKKFFVKWNLQSIAIPLLVTLSPVQGASFIAFIYSILGTFLGSVFGYVSLITWGTSPPYGLSFFTALFALPVCYVATNTPYVVGSLIARITFSSVILASYLNRDNPAFDKPFTRGYKSLAVTGMIIAAVFFVQVFIYPNYARRVLRHQLCELLENFRFYYEKVSQITSLVMDKKTKEEEVKALSQECYEREIILQTKLLSLHQLLLFAAAEPRLSGPFQTKIYEQIFHHIQVMLDRISWARTSIGTRPFCNKVIDDFYLPMLDARKEVVRTFRILLYVYANTMKSKLPLPNALPSAVEARHNWVQKMLEVTKKLQISGRLRDGNSNNEYLRYYALTLAMRGNAIYIDQMRECLKELFGLSEGLGI